MAQGWFAGRYAHESVGLPPISRVRKGQPMGMAQIRKLGQASLVTEWGRQGHTFVRYVVSFFYLFFYLLFFNFSEQP